MVSLWPQAWILAAAGVSVSDVNPKVAVGEGECRLVSANTEMGLNPVGIRPACCVPLRAGYWQLVKATSADPASGGVVSEAAEITTGEKTSGLQVAVEVPVSVANPSIT
jgi:hypothetical protein